MKCSRCGNDAKYRDREARSGACPSCGGKFAFEPMKGDPVTDVLFKTAIDAVSAGGRIRFGVEHVYYEACRRMRRRWRVRGGIVAFLLVLAGGAAALAVAALVGERRLDDVCAGAAALGFALLLCSGLAWYVARGIAPHVPLAAAAFAPLWDKWVAAHGAPSGVITRREAPAPRPELEPDIADYSFDRVVVCDRARTVDLLLANNFHFEHNCAVLGVEGYPKGPFPVVKKMLTRNPRLQVFALHDATIDGCRLPFRLARDPAWFGPAGRVVDVGLRPGQTSKYRGLYRPSTTRVTVGGGITQKEAEWLSRYTLELAAIRPEQVLRRLFAAVSRQRETDRRPKPDDDWGPGIEATEADGGKRPPGEEQAEVEQDAALDVEIDSPVDGGDDGFG